MLFPLRRPATAPPADASHWRDRLRAAAAVLAVCVASVATTAGCGTDVEEGVVEQSEEEPEYPEDY